MTYTNSGTPPVEEGLTAASRTLGVLREVLDERGRQTAKHGDQVHLPDGTGPGVFLYGLRSVTGEPVSHLALSEWARTRTKAASYNEGGDGTITMAHVLMEEFAEALAEAPDSDELRAELVQATAVGVQMIEYIDRRREAGR